MFEKQSLAKFIAIGLIAAASPSPANAFEEMRLPERPAVTSDLIVEKDPHISESASKSGSFTLLASAAVTSAITTAFLKEALFKDREEF